LGDVLKHVPRLGLAQHVGALGLGLPRACRRAGLCSLFPRDAEPYERAELAAELDRLPFGEVAEMLNLQLTVFVLANGQRVDDAYRVALAEPLELGDDLAVKVGVVESQYDQLHRSNCHVALRFSISARHQHLGDRGAGTSPDADDVPSSRRTAPARAGESPARRPIRRGRVARPTHPP